MRHIPLFGQEQNLSGKQEPLFHQGWRGSEQPGQEGDDVGGVTVPLPRRRGALYRRSGRLKCQILHVGNIFGGLCLKFHRQSSALELAWHFNADFLTF